MTETAEQQLDRLLPERQEFTDAIIRLASGLVAMRASRDGWKEEARLRRTAMEETDGSARWYTAHARLKEFLAIDTGRFATTQEPAPADQAAEKAS